MRRLFAAALVAALLGGGWLVLNRFHIEGLDQVRLRPRTPATPTGSQEGLSPVRDASETIRMATFNIQVFGDSKAGKPHVMRVLVDVIRRFDLVAIQEIRTKNQQMLPAFVDQINAEGRQYDFVIGPRQGRTVSKEQYAFVFDTASIEVDRSACYVVHDPEDLLHRPPLVGTFRVRGVPVEQAFTFTLANIHTDPDETDTELDALADVYRQVVRSSGGEDDVIILGDLNVDDMNLGLLGQVPGIQPVLTGIPTNTRGTRLLDNFIYHEPSTTEYTGRAGVLDLMRELNMTMAETLQVSDHLPVWAEFSVYERGARGSVARRPQAEAVR